MKCLSSIFNSDVRANALTFISLFIVLAAVISDLHAEYVIKRSSLERTDNQLGLSNLTRVLVMGDSHALMDFTPRAVAGCEGGRCVNYGAHAENYVLTYYKLVKVLRGEEGQRLRVVVLPVDLHSFSSARLKSFNTNGWYNARYVDFLEVAVETKDPEFVQYELYHVFPFMWEGKWFLQSMEGGGRKRDVNFAVTALFAGVEPYSEPGQVFDSKVALYFNKTLTLCRENNITVFLVKYPVTAEYYALSGSYIPDKRSYYDRIYGIAREYDEVYLLDYQDVYFDKKSNFQDSDHLNAKGAKGFSTMLIEDIHLRKGKISR